jgi:16S rRNA (cytosine1402-N4)-methyltransferase
MEFAHQPIMVQECMGLLQPQRGGIFVDGTLGGGGHAQATLERLPADGRLIGVDRDDEALAAASKRLQPFGQQFTAVKGNFFDMKELLLNQGISGVDGILVDLGVSSYQLDNPQRGFSYNEDAPLDMRMDQQAGFSAYDVVNGYSKEELTRIIRDYGEEKWASRIAQFILEARNKKNIESTWELVKVIKKAIPASARREGPHPAKRTFQAIRIEVNHELDELEQALEGLTQCLNPEGVLAVITFHSLEDRITKKTFQRLQNPCTCPPKSPICICGKVPSVTILTRKPLTASPEELEHNHRARSAKLRGVRKL